MSIRSPTKWVCGLVEPPDKGIDQALVEWHNDSFFDEGGWNGENGLEGMVQRAWFLKYTDEAIKIKMVNRQTVIQ